MRLLKRNLTEFSYIPHLGETDIDPETGKHTGDPVPTWGEPVPMTGNISTPSLHVNPTFYGEDIRYTHTLVMDDPDAGIDEYGEILWKGDRYEIRAVRPSLNVLSVALRKKTKDNSEPEGEEDEPEGEEDEP